MNDEPLCLMCKNGYTKTFRNGYAEERCRIFGAPKPRPECAERHFSYRAPDKPKYPVKTGRSRKKPSGGYRMVRQKASLCEMCANLEGSICRATGKVNPSDCVENFVYDGSKQKKNAHTA